MKNKFYVISLLILVIVTIINIDKDYKSDAIRILIDYIVFHIIWNAVILFVLNKYTKQGNLAMIIFSILNLIASVILLLGETIKVDSL